MPSQKCRKKRTEARVRMKEEGFIQVSKGMLDWARATGAMTSKHQRYWLPESFRKEYGAAQALLGSCQHLNTRHEECYCSFRCMSDGCGTWCRDCGKKIQRYY